MDSLKYLDPSLNESQKGAVRFALEAAEVALIHGPPGVCCTIFLFHCSMDLRGECLDRENAYTCRDHTPIARSRQATACVRRKQPGCWYVGNRLWWLVLSRNY